MGARLSSRGRPEGRVHVVWIRLIPPRREPPGDVSTARMLPRVERRTMTTLNHLTHPSAQARCRSFRPGRLAALLLPVAAFAFLLALAFSAPVFADDCTDTDSDGYVTCQGCDAPGGTTCSECDVGNGDVNPGETETCNNVDDDCNGTVDDEVVPDPINGVDDDNDGEIDEGFARCTFHAEGPGDVCKTAGATLCVNGSHQ